MERRTTLNVDLVAVQTADEVAVLLDLVTPATAAAMEPHTLQVAQAVSLVIRPADSVPAFTVWNDLPVSGIDDGVIVELGDFHAGEQRRILLGFQVPAMPALGAATICELELRWVDLASMTEKVATVPVNVNGPLRRLVRREATTAGRRA
jgi:Ca-activated chloride channel family protein